MGKDLIRRTGITKSEQAKTKEAGTKQTEVERAQRALAESMLFGARTPPQQAGPPRIILGLDCTSSMGEYVEARHIAPEVAATIANGLFLNCGVSCTSKSIVPTSTSAPGRQMKL